MTTLTILIITTLGLMGLAVVVAGYIYMEEENKENKEIHTK